MTNSELEKLIASAESESEKINALNRLAWSLRDSEPTRAVELAQEAICLLNNQDPDDDASLGEAHFALGWAVSRVAQFKSKAKAT